jgi:hypothetical protein
MKWRIAMNGEQVRIWKEFTTANFEDVSRQPHSRTEGKTARG